MIIQTDLYGFSGSSQAICTLGYPISLDGNQNGGVNIDVGDIWPTANKAFFYPFTIYSPITISKAFILNASAVSGNVDIGVYDKNGNRLGSTGQTVNAGTVASQIINLTADTLLSLPGYYYLAIAINNTTARPQNQSQNVNLCKFLGYKEQTSAFPLPNPATMVEITAGYIPWVGLLLK